MQHLVAFSWLNLQLLWSNEEHSWMRGFLTWCWEFGCLRKCWEVWRGGHCCSLGIFFPLIFQDVVLWARMDRGSHLLRPSVTLGREPGAGWREEARLWQCGCRALWAVMSGSPSQVSLRGQLGVPFCNSDWHGLQPTHRASGRHWVIDMGPCHPHWDLGFPNSLSYDFPRIYFPNLKSLDHSPPHAYLQVQKFWLIWTRDSLTEICTGKCIGATRCSEIQTQICIMLSHEKLLSRKLSPQPCELGKVWL